MSASIFSETELARLASFPEEIPGDDLIRAFTLTGADRDLVAVPIRDRGSSVKSPTPKESGKRRVACAFAPFLDW